MFGFYMWGYFTHPSDLWNIPTQKQFMCSPQTDPTLKLFCYIIPRKGTNWVSYNNGLYVLHMDMIAAPHIRSDIVSCTLLYTQWRFGINNVLRAIITP